MNLLKPYDQRSEDGEGVKGSACPALAVDICGVAQESDAVPEPDDSLLCGRLKNSESLAKLDSLLSHLPVEQHVELVELIGEFPLLFGDVPSHTTWIEHDIVVGEAQPIKQQFYLMSPKKFDHMNSEVVSMLKHGIAVPSTSS